MPFTCISCRKEIDPAGPNCPYCGEVLTDFLRTYMVHLIDGKYQILERLGRGGMGEVYKVLHTHLGVTRVIKTMRPRLADDATLHERFAREAKLATRINHPNVAMLYDFSALPDGSFYMVWEYIQGTNLATLIRRRGRLDPRLALDIAIPALHGMEAIHAAGVIHRDISPENIMVSAEASGQLNVKVIDLGIAKSETVDDALTSTGMFVGKWKYASPEHMGLLKEGEVLDGRADLFSFGVVLYEMLAGRAPYEATTPGQYLLLQMKDPNPVNFEKVTFPEAPGLEQIIRCALDKDRDNRFPTARAFVDALAAVRAALPDPSDAETTGTPAPTGDLAGREPTLLLPTPTPVGTAGRAGTQSARGTSPAAGQVGRTPTAPGTQPTAALPTPAVGRGPQNRTAVIVAIVAVVVLLAAAGATIWLRHPKPQGDDGTASAATNTTQRRQQQPGVVSSEQKVSPRAVDTTPSAPNPQAPVATTPQTTPPRVQDSTPPIGRPAEGNKAAKASTTTPTGALAMALPTAPPARPSGAAKETAAAPAAPKTAVETAAPAAKPAVEPPPPPKDEPVVRDDRIATAGPMGRRSRQLTASDAWKENFPRGIIQTYEDLYSGANVDWAAIGRGVKLSQYKVVVEKLQNRTAYDAGRIVAALENDLPKQLAENAGDKGTVTAQIAIVWAATEGRSRDDIAFEMIFREGGARGPVLAKFHHRVSARNPEGLAEDVVDAIREFVQDHPTVQ